MRTVALIIGIDGWSKYTLPLYTSLQQHEPTCEFVIIDNASETPYPILPFVHRTERLCYSKAINRAAQIAGPADWYIVLSNDVFCEGPFTESLQTMGESNVVYGPLLKKTHGFTYLEGWCVCASGRVWDALGGWDENFQVSSWEDVDFSTRALEHGYNIAQTDIPFRHLDQRQRFGLIPDYWESEKHNVAYFISRHVQQAAA